MKLYEIAADIRALGNEDLTPQEAADKFRALAGSFEDKLRGVIALQMELTAEAGVRADHAKRMATSAKTMQAKADGLMDYAQIQIQNVAMPLPIRFPEFTLNMAKMPPKTEVFDQSILPISYKNRTVILQLTNDELSTDEFLALLKGVGVLEHSQTTGVSESPLKTVIGTDLKEGVLIPGARFEPLAYRLTVK